MVKLIFAVFILAGFLYLLILGGKLQSEFVAYCEKVAKAEGLMDELNSGAPGEGGLNKFESGVYFDLFRSESKYQILNDSIQRAYFRKRFAMMMFVAILVVVGASVFLEKYF